MRADFKTPNGIWNLKMSIDWFFSSQLSKLEIDIYQKWLIQITWNLALISIVLRWTNSINFMSLCCMDLEKLTTVTYNQFVFISMSLHPFTLLFGVEMYYIEGNMHTKFQPKLICNFGRKTLLLSTAICLLSRYWCIHLLWFFVWRCTILKGTSTQNFIQNRFFIW